MATRGEIKLRARRRADMVHSTFIGDDELNEYFQGSYGELYDLLVSSFEDYYSKSQTTTVGPGQSSIAVPADMYKMRGLDLQLTPDAWTTIGQFNFAERNANSRAVNRVITGARSVVYRLMGQNIMLLPESAAPNTYRLWYIPRVTGVTDDATQIGDVLDFDEYIVVDMAIKMLTKQEDDISSLLVQKQALIARINTMVTDRDAGSPQTVQDVETANYIDDYLFPR